TGRLNPESSLESATLLKSNSNCKSNLVLAFSAEENSTKMETLAMRHLNETSGARAVSLIEDGRSFHHVSRTLDVSPSVILDCGADIGRHMDTRGGQGKADYALNMCQFLVFFGGDFSKPSNLQHLCSFEEVRQLLLPNVHFAIVHEASTTPVPVYAFVDIGPFINMFGRGFMMGR
ncbi:hypothetical protein C0J52_26296, partial [Blattella germanica]